MPGNLSELKSGGTIAMLSPTLKSGGTRPPVPHRSTPVFPHIQLSSTRRVNKSNEMSPLMWSARIVIRSARIVIRSVAVALGVLCVIQYYKIKSSTENVVIAKKVRIVSVKYKTVLTCTCSTHTLAYTQPNSFSVI